MRCNALHALLVPLGLIAVQACSERQSGTSDSVGGGATISGGHGSLGGASSGSSTPSTGGALVVQGGTSQSDATRSSTDAVAAAGGPTTSGGAQSAGGAHSVGGNQSTGGIAVTSSAKTSGGVSAAGGAKSSAGSPATGGAKNSGGAKNTGGTNASGGTKNTGGVLATGGKLGTAGTTGADVCDNAAEDASVTLTCPQGQIIDHVVFASYGTPSGTCGSFVTGSCDASSSQAMVESLCVGRSTCSVPATNGAFGDPCRSTTKHLAVEVACVVGTPIVTANAPYKGIANSPASQIAALGATWCYNWGTTPKTTDCADPYFVPMIWGSGDIAGAIKAIGNAGYTTVLGFNEPNKSDQANMSVADAIALWPTVTSNPNIRVSSPAVSDNGRSWLEDFMTQAKSKGLRVDFIAMHWYGWNSGSCVASQLEGAVNWASQWGLPVWITEFGCMGTSNPDEQTVLKFFNDAIKMLNNHPLVERYAWYPWNTYNELYKNDASNVAVMTSLGSAFAAAPQYRP